MPAAYQSICLKTGFWKKEYLRILLNGPSGHQDFNIALELIEAGYAKGAYQISRRKEDYGQVTSLVWQGVNTEGRLFADQLQEQLYRQSWRYRITNFGIWLAGVATGFWLDIAKDWIERQLF